MRFNPLCVKQTLILLTESVWNFYFKSRNLQHYFRNFRNLEVSLDRKETEEVKEEIKEEGVGGVRRVVILPTMY